MADIQVAHCPERVLPGRILEEVVNNARVIGGMTRKCAQRALGLYRMVVRGECRVTSARTAELAKLTENAYRDVNIAFANELSLICDKLKRQCLGADRDGQPPSAGQILQPGPGRGRALHRRRSLVHRRHQSGRSEADPHRPYDQ